MQTIWSDLYETDYKPEAVMPRVGGKPWRCEVCNANVAIKRGNRYTCNGCRTVYEGK